ncbi:hypothetical protein HZH68_000946 [Vespula germanica]|uniref:Uncharacterized protein n=1 Tax=Vespula germanica TaxID=30212 RepID=A0A834U6F6_VESGE|nr:hypothetical protein HZH68_000946 [Vespula germanica]
MLREIDGRADVRERLSCVEGFESDSGCFGWCFQVGRYIRTLNPIQVIWLVKFHSPSPSEQFMKLTIIKSRIRELCHNIHFTDVAMRSQIAKQFAEGFESVQLGKIGDAIARVTKCIVFRHDEANVYETVFPQGINSVSKS